VNPIISQNSRIRHPELLEIGEDSIIDDYCYISARLRLGRCTHVASGCSIAGGARYQCTIGNYSSLSSGVKIWCASDDFVNDVITIIPPDVENPKENFITGDVTLGDYTAVGSNSVIMPYNTIPEGSVIGALSFAPTNYPFKAWAVYAGTPVRYLRPRNRDSVLEQVRRLEQALRNRGARV
jgi:acetyltransferase-like isoleucine patch superfamily enzyme